MEYAPAMYMPLVETFFVLSGVTARQAGDCGLVQEWHQQRLFYGLDTSQNAVL